MLKVVNRLGFIKNAYILKRYPEWRYFETETNRISVDGEVNASAKTLRQKGTNENKLVWKRAQS